ncbi:MAG: response regulator [Campylobacteraceae bacterium]|nr:response regulator [Campylobacteraceae bacterium]
MKVELFHELSSITVLYAEDEPGLREQMGETLGMLFKSVYLAKDGKEAMELHAKHSPDLLITDLQMPEFGGMDLVKGLREKGDKTPIIIFSAHTEIEDMLDAIELSLVRYIVKPMTETKLLEALEKFIRMREKDMRISLAPKWFVDFSRHCIETPEEKLELTKKESALLKLLLSKGSVCTYSEIENYVWGEESMSLNALRLLVKNLRKKLPNGLPKNIQGVGYSL